MSSLERIKSLAGKLGGRSPHLLWLYQQDAKALRHIIEVYEAAEGLVDTKFIPVYERAVFLEAYNNDPLKEDMK